MMMKKAEKYIDGLIGERVPYLDVAVYREHRELFRHYAGLSPVSGKELLYMYSCTKPMTVTCAMRLIEEGRLHLSDRVGDILPAFRGAHLRDGEGNERPPREAPTVRHLLTMSVGLCYDGGRYYPIARALEERGERTPTRAVIDCLPESPLLFEPGERFQYSLCHDVLGAVIEEASGMRFSDYMRKVLIEPLGMENTRFGAPRNEEIADIYTADDDGTVRRTEKENGLIFAAGYESGGAGLISTVDDYARFTDMLASGGTAASGERILSEESLRLMRTPVFSGISIDGGFTCVQGREYGYGLGVRTRTVATPWGLPVGEFGWDGAAGSYIMADPVNKISVTMGMHVMNWPAVFRGEHLEIVRRVYEALSAEKAL